MKATTYPWCGTDREHRVVWEREHGPIPPGAVIHHIDGDPRNNDLSNLMLCASQRDHVRLHHGWRIVDGQWWKPCTRCGEMKPVEEFYPRRTGTAERMGQCRLCQSATARERVAKRVCERCGAEYRPAFGGQKFCEECRA